MNERALVDRLHAGPATETELAALLDCPARLIEEQLSTLAGHIDGLRRRADGCWSLGMSLDVHHPAQLLAGLSPSSRAAIASLDCAWSVDSTNAVLRRQATASAGLVVLLAETQTSGLGRRGKHWVSPLSRHVYLSVACPFAAGMGAMAGLSLAVGASVADSLSGLGMADISLKWPNDVLCGGGKLAGILVESQGSASGPARAIIGIGINVHGPGVRATAPVIDQPWTWVNRHSPSPVMRDQVAAAVLDGLIGDLDLFAQHGLPAFLSRWQARDMLAGQPVWVEDGCGLRRAAIAVGLGDDGSLKVADGSSSWHVHAGNVSVRKQ